ncbi:MAG: DUF1653 domain-containing protein [Candidatus Harrisonbacteria bacterium]|nr:DUF1653 domain-containing protein [Candidatus Harrisonbacteria bacterium]
MQKIQAGQTYQHFKGGEYKVIALAKHSETEEEMVLYEHDGQNWVRPASMWFDEVDRPEFDYKGPRFKLIQ